MTKPRSKQRSLFDLTPEIKPLDGGVPLEPARKKRRGRAKKPKAAPVNWVSDEELK